ncbi:MAG: class I SAM-dependent methyltransferase [Deltaproteobacteria bacterium]|nr:class I SAM-dependent methyltransferase [Deltaproteobacteria bacterium]MBN2670328.1 class I SAM-dependent methyltransferase [Deltaproteobacteria bacterium]
MKSTILLRITNAIAARADCLRPPHNNAFRLFNGFTEGAKEFTVDVYGKTLVIHDYRSEAPARADELPDAIAELLLERISFTEAIIYKRRKGRTADERNGILLRGDTPDTRIVEDDVQYALAMTLNRDAGFYIDTRGVRRWILDHMLGKTVLNTFAYTGSLGIAAMAANAKEVIQTDLNRVFLNVAKQSCAMNGFPVIKRNFVTGDFFMVMKQFTRQERTFDCVILDPPFFSTTAGGRVDLENNMTRLINKIRPLVKNGGNIIAINNAVYLPGKEYINTLNDLCSDSYVSIESTIPVPKDCAGYPQTVVEQPFIDPSPFNHSTKIVVLKITHK